MNKQEIINYMKEVARYKSSYGISIFTCLILKEIKAELVDTYQAWLIDNGYSNDEKDSIFISVYLNNFDYVGKFRMFLKFMQTIKESDL